MDGWMGAAMGERIHWLASFRPLLGYAFLCTFIISHAEGREEGGEIINNAFGCGSLVMSGREEGLGCQLVISDGMLVVN